MRLSADNGYHDFTVIDDATKAKLKDVLWVDDQALEYAVHGQMSIWGMRSIKVTPVTAVAVNYAAREIRVNEPQPVILTLTMGGSQKQPNPCDACCQEETCRRIDYCARYRTRFGEADTP